MIEPLPSLPTKDLLLVGILGEGGSARVYRAWLVEAGHWVAVKVLKAEASGRARDRFVEEARLLSAMSHRNLVKALVVGAEQEPPFYVMEIADGGSLRDWTERHGAMGPRIAVDAMIQICKGVAVAHKAGIVHCDIKPHNILVNRRGICKLTDFGAARALRIPLDPGRPSMDEGDTDKVGTLGYMAPEQQSDPGSIDVRADVYGLAATLYHLLAGKSPPSNLFMAAREYPETFAGLPDPLVPILLKATSFKPADRYDSAMELARALDATWEFLPAGANETPLLKGFPHEPTPPPGMTSRTPVSSPPATAPGARPRFPERPSLPPASMPPGSFHRRVDGRSSMPAGSPDRTAATPPGSEPSVEGASVEPVSLVPQQLAARAVYPAWSEPHAPDVGRAPPDIRQIAAERHLVEPIHRTRWPLVVVGLIALAFGLFAADVSWVASARRGAEHGNLVFAEVARRNVSVMDDLAELGADRAALEVPYRGIRQADTAAERHAAAVAWVAQLHAALPAEGDGRLRRVVKDRLDELDGVLAEWTGLHERWAWRASHNPGAPVSGLVGTPDSR